MHTQITPEFNEAALLFQAEFAKSRAMHAKHPPLLTPIYKTGKHDGWTLITQPQPIGRGYYAGAQRVIRPNFALKDAKGRVWMSITPLELESQSVPVRLAKGHVVVMGLGMGVVAFNLCRNPEVTKVTVVEKSSAVISLFHEITDVYSWQGNEKLNIVRCDALTFTTKETVDLLYVDIWPELFTDEALSDTQKIQANVMAAGVSYWGQELDAAAWLFAREKEYPNLNAAAWEAFVASTGIPLIGGELKDYPDLIMAAAENISSM